MTLIILGFHAHLVCLQPDNILLEANKALNEIKIIDFGLAANLVGTNEVNEGTVVNGRIRERRGTVRYMAPEVLKCDYGPKCDVSDLCFSGSTQRSPFVAFANKLSRSGLVA